MYRFAVFALVFASVISGLVSAASAQTKAKCTFHFFNPPGIPAGVNDYGTTVGGGGQQWGLERIHPLLEWNGLVFPSAQRPGNRFHGSQ
jgi:hypothetical protein